MIDLNALPLDVTEHIIKFRNFLRESWPYLDEIMNKHDWDEDGNFTSDWLQCCWEFLVERELLGNNDLALTQFSVVPFHSRVVYPSKQATHTVLAKFNKSDSVYDLRSSIPLPLDKPMRLFGFMTYKDKGYGFYPPFDLALLTLDLTNETYIASLEKLKFVLTRIFH